MNQIQKTHEYFTLYNDNCDEKAQEAHWTKRSLPPEFESQRGLI